jgi:hypothetical protein
MRAMKEVPMQERPGFLSGEDRRSIRRWRWISIGVYGCLLAGFIAYLTFNQHRAADYAAADQAATALPGNPVPPR